MEERINGSWLNHSIKEILTTATKWAKFLSILGFVFLGLSVLLMVIGAIAAPPATQYAQVSTVNSYSVVSINIQSISWLSVAVYIIMAIIVFIPLYFLYRFSADTKLALKNGDITALTSGFRYLRDHYKYIGILAIVWLICFVAMVIMLVIGASYVM